MYAKQGNCGTICQQIIDAQTSAGNINIHGNDFTSICNNQTSPNNSSPSWWPWAEYANSPGTPPPDTTTHYWWGHWQQTTDADGNPAYTRALSTTAIIGIVVAGVGAILLPFIIYRILRSPSQPSTT